MISAHTHVETVLTGSTLETMISKMKTMERKYFAYTDFSYFISALKAYDLCNKNGIKPILGVEVFFKDSNCPLFRHSNARNAQYFKTTLYATNQEQFQLLGQLSSEVKNTVKFFEERYPAWDWEMLEKVSQAGCLIGSADVHDMVSKHFIVNSPEIAEQVFLKIKGYFKENTYLTIVGTKQDRRFIQFVEVLLEDGIKLLIPANEKFQTNAARSVSAMELVDNPNKHIVLINTFIGKLMKGYNKKIIHAIAKKGNIKLKEGDIQFTANKGTLSLSRKYDIPLLYSDYACYADIDDKAAQDVKLSSDGRREYVGRHIQSDHEMTKYLAELGLNELEIDQTKEDQSKWASKFDNFNLKFGYRLPTVDGNPMAIISETIKKVGRLPIDNEAYVSRLRYELDVLANNGQINLLPYFIPLLKVYQEAITSGTGYGPGRGSAPGSLLSYLIGITHCDPIKYGLSFERFFSLDRALAKSLPDIDCDFSSRDFLVGDGKEQGYLSREYGDKFSQVSTKSLLRLKSAIKDVNRYIHGKVEKNIEFLTKVLPSAPQGVADSDFVFGYTDDEGNEVPGLIEINDDLIKYTQERPKEWALVIKCLGLGRSSSVHASAFLLADTAIKNVVPVLDNGATQYEAKYCEKAGLVKYDFLVVNQLKDIEDCLKRINQKAGVNLPPMNFSHNGKHTFVWDLPQDECVFESVWNAQTETIFQISTGAMRPFVEKIKPRSIEDLSTILALVRPGPLDYVDPVTNRNMAEEYIERRYGRSQPDIEIMGKLLPETWGVMCFQEQTQKVSKEVGNMSANDAEKLRRAMAKKQKIEVGQYKKIFMEGAIQKVGEATAEKIWAQMETSSRYSFNLSHSTVYGMITYACMFLKYYYPLEWWAAVLSNADEAEYTNVLFKYVKDFILPPDINLSSESMEINYEDGKIRSKFSTLKGLGGKSVEKLVSGRPYKDIADFVRKDVAGPSLAKRLIHVGVLDSIFPKNATAYDKMKSYADAIELVKYEEKVAKGTKNPILKEGVVDPEFIGISAIEDFCIRKEIMPTISISLSELILQEAHRMDEGSAGNPMYSNSRGYPIKYLHGDNLQAFEKWDHQWDVQYCFSAYVVKAEEKAYQKNTRKRLILTLDMDGIISERILWPDYNTGVLTYPKGLQKGSIAFFFCKTKKDRSPSIYDIVLEKEARLSKPKKNGRI